MAVKPTTICKSGGDPDVETVIRLVRHRAENRYLIGRSRCAEAVLSVINRGLRGDLSMDLAVRLASGLPEGVSGSGCICGALSAGMLAIGLFLGDATRAGVRRHGRVQPAAKALHDRFRSRFGSTCCRVLTRKVGYGTRAHFRHCAGLTGEAAEMTAGIILAQRSELVEAADLGYLSRTDSFLGTGLKTVADMIRG
ncbi:MAG: C-GCAxxG-C-C family protein [Desulfobacterales bacterium]|jgi:C_GCAxxG_C_C family probable redox protein